MMTRPRILLFEDKLGVSSGYEDIWGSLLMRAGFKGFDQIRRNSFKALGMKVKLLTQKGNRKSPGFNPDPRAQAIIQKWAFSQIEQYTPTLILLQDPALFFLVNPNWEHAITDNLRGGVYRIQDIPTVVIYSLGAWHQKKREKDIARLNEGFVDKEEWEEAHGGEEADTEGVGAIWLEPPAIPYGRFVLRKDLEKAWRVMQREIESTLIRT